MNVYPATTFKVQGELLETSAATLERIDLADISVSQLCDLSGSAQHGMTTTSGLNDYDYQNLSNITLGGKMLEQVETINKIPIPAEVLEHLKHIKCHCLMGLFSEIGRAWLTIDSEIYIWTYEQSRDLAYYDGLNNLILSVGLAPPVAGVFIGDIKYLLILTTPIEIVVLGITLIDSTKTVSSPNRCVQNTATFREMQFMNKPIFILNTDNVAFGKIESSKNGRIFLGGKDGCLYELVYQAESSWLGKRCRKINHSKNLLSSMVPVLFKIFSDIDAVKNIVIDESRQLLYVLTEKGSIEGWNMGKNYNEMYRFSRITEDDVSKVATSIIKTVDASIFKNITSISPISSEDSSNLQLLAVTQSGVRLLFATTPLNSIQGFQCPQQTPNQRPFPSMDTNPQIFGTFEYKKPVGLFLHHVRLPPGYTPNTTLHKPRQVHSSYFSEGISLLISSQGQEQDVLWSMSFSPFCNPPHFAESTSLIPLDGSVWSFAEMPEKNEIKMNLKLCKARASKKIVILTNQGVHIVALLKPFDVLQQLLDICNGPHHQAVKSFFQGKTQCEACVTCLLIACSDQRRGTDIGMWALQAFFLYGGEPSYQYQVLNTPGSHMYPNPPHGISARTSMDTSFERNPNNNSTMQSYALNASNNRLSSSPMTKDCANAITYSAKHNALYVYVARLLRPVWRKRCVDNNLHSTLTQDDCNIILKDLYALEQFLEVNFGKEMSCTVPVSKSPRQVMPTFNTTDQARDEEKLSLNALNCLIKHICEVVSLWKVLCEHQFQTVASQLPKEEQTTLRSCTLRDLTLSCTETCHSLLRILISSYLRDSTSVNPISKKLRDICPNLYKHEDAISFKATEIIMAAKSCESVEEKCDKLRLALGLCKDAAPNLPLQNICQQFTLTGFYEGVIELTATCAAKIDPDEIGIHFYNNDEPSEDREGFSAYAARMSCYKEVCSMLEHIYQSTYVASNEDMEFRAKLISVCDTNLSKQITKVLNLAMQIRDPILHINIYEWLMNYGMITELLAITEPSLGEFLRRNVMRNPGNFKLIDLLWKYYEKIGSHAKAARILDKLACSESDVILLEQRLEYLARAIICMRNDSVGYSISNGSLLKELEDKLEVGRIQKNILNTLSSDVIPINNLAQVQKELNFTLYDISTLYQKFAEPYNLCECKLTILNCSHHNDPLLIESIWREIINKCIKGKGSPQERSIILFTKMKSLVKEFRESGHCFPLEFIIRELEIKACQLQLPAGTVPNELIKMDLDIEILMDYYFRMVSMNERVWVIEGNEWQLIQSSIQIVTALCNNMKSMWNRSRMRILEKAQDIVATCLSFCYQKPNTEQLQTNLKELQCQLLRF